MRLGSSSKDHSAVTLAARKASSTHIPSFGMKCQTRAKTPRYVK